VRLSRLLVEETPSEIGRVMAWELAETCLSAGLPGLPGHMRRAAQEAAWAYVRTEEWADHLFLCLLLAQSRTGAEDASEVALRRELEEILLEVLFGAVRRGCGPARTAATWLDKVALRTVRTH